MDTQFGLTRSSVNLRSNPDVVSHIVEALNSQEHVQILQEQGNFLEVQATRWTPPMQGFVLKSAIITDKPVQPVFPVVNIGSGSGIAIPSVPPSVPLSTFLTWFTSGGESPWLPASYLDDIHAGRQPSVGAQIRDVINSRRSDWDAWVTEVQGQGRLDIATLDEWLVILNGGREMWSFRPERLFTQPSQSAAAPAWVVPADVVHWTGHVQINNKEPKYKVWNEIAFTKLDREFKGWYKASLLEEFFFPTPADDMTIPGNKDTVFNLSAPLLRLPADPEIQDALKAKRNAAQFIDVKGATGWGKIEHNLCGQFCAAALGGSDVIPFLKQWLPGYARAKGILQNDFGTTILDLQSMLDVFKKPYEFFRAEGSISPITPGYLRKMLDTGRMAIIGTGITNQGVVKWGSRIRHWVVVEDFIRVGNSGWVRIYNPFPNREEVYPFEVVFDTVSHSAIGLWVAPTPPV